MVSLQGINRVFFSGIGGISMSAVALIMHGNGYEVWGSDIACGDNTRRLEQAGIRVEYAHRAENIRDAQLLVYNARIHGDNPERMAAAAKGIPCVTRAEMIGILMKQSPCPIGISGTHGKSTATAMMGQVFLSAGLDPTVLIGAVYTPFNGAHKLGGGEHFIFEACEYTDSFLSFFPKIALVLNVEMDHPDYFRNIDHMVDSFRRFAAITGSDGALVYNADSTGAVRAAEGYQGRSVSFSLKKGGGDVYCTNLRYERGCGRFEVYVSGRLYAEIALKVPGEFNVANALGVCAAAWLCGIPG